MAGAAALMPNRRLKLPGAPCAMALDAVLSSGVVGFHL